MNKHMLLLLACSSLVIGRRVPPSQAIASLLLDLMPEDAFMPSGAPRTPTASATASRRANAARMATEGDLVDYQGDRWMINTYSTPYQFRCTSQTTGEVRDFQADELYPLPAATGTMTATAQAAPAPAPAYAPEPAPAPRENMFGWGPQPAAAPVYAPEPAPAPRENMFGWGPQPAAAPVYAPEPAPAPMYAPPPAPAPLPPPAPVYAPEPAPAAAAPVPAPEPEEDGPKFRWDNPMVGFEYYQPKERKSYPQVPAGTSVTYEGKPYTIKGGPWGGYYWLDGGSGTVEDEAWATEEDVATR